MKLLWVLCCVQIFGLSQGAKILGVFHVDSYSHHILGHRLMEELANKGHQVTMISARKNVETNPNFKSVYLENILQTYEENSNSSVNDMERLVNMSPFKSAIFVSEIGVMLSDLTLNHANVQKHLSENHHYDLVIVEQFLADAIKGFCYHYKAPCISFNSVASGILVDYVVYNTAPSSYIPNTFTKFSSKMTFCERAYNLVLNNFFDFITRAYYVPKHGEIMQKYFPGAPDMHDMLANMSLVFLNSHPSISQPVPIPPNMIELGGIHIQAPKKLPEDLQKFLDGGKEGVIFFSLGSNLQSKDLRPEQRDDIISALAQLKQKVLWKFEDDTIKNLPKNIKLAKWLPQNEVLAHPNVKIFISHGGFLSFSEAMHYGVPVVGIPFYGDQRRNVAEMEVMGVGIGISFENFNGKSILSAVQKMLQDESYTENAKMRSKLMKDRPMNATDTAVYWVEYVLRNKGAEHLRSSAFALTWYQYWMLDVLSVMLIICLIPVLAIYYVAKKIARCTCKQKKADKQKKQ